MKRWRKYALCIACVCCMAVLTGCGNDGKKNETEKEKETQAVTAEDQTAGTEGSAADGDLPSETNVENGATADAGKEDAAQENGGAADAGTDSNVNGVTDENNADEMEDNADQTAENENTDGGVVGNAGSDLIDGAGDAGKDVIDGVSDAGKDVIDSVGDAGKDVIDGVENAGDALTGTDDANNENP